MVNSSLERAKEEGKYVHGDYSVIGSESCDFLATVLTFRLIKAFDKAGLLEKMNYSRIMALLRRAKKVRVGEDGVWRLVKVNPKLEAMLGTLGLTHETGAPARRQPGRPPKLQKCPAPAFSAAFYLISPCAAQGDLVSFSRFHGGMASAGWSARNSRQAGAVRASA